MDGKSAGVVWHPPYVIDLTSLVKPGKNELRIVVGNTAINSMAGRALPDYRLLNDRYGERFVPQGMENLAAAAFGHCRCFKAENRGDRREALSCRS